MKNIKLLCFLFSILLVCTPIAASNGYEEAYAELEDTIQSFALKDSLWLDVDLRNGNLIYDFSGNEIGYIFFGDEKGYAIVAKDVNENYEVIEASPSISNPFDKEDSEYIYGGPLSYYNENPFNDNQKTKFLFDDREKYNFVFDLSLNNFQRYSARSWSGIVLVSGLNSTNDFPGFLQTLYDKPNELHSCVPTAAVNVIAYYNICRGLEFNDDSEYNTSTSNWKDWNGKQLITDMRKYMETGQIGSVTGTDQDHVMSGLQRFLKEKVANYTLDYTDYKTYKSSGSFAAFEDEYIRAIDYGHPFIITTGPKKGASSAENYYHGVAGFGYSIESDGSTYALVTDSASGYKYIEYIISPNTNNRYIDATYEINLTKH